MFDVAFVVGVFAILVLPFAIAIGGGILSFFPAKTTKKDNYKSGR